MHLKFFSVLLFICLCYQSIANGEFSPEVTITQGLLKGEVAESRNGTEFYKFFGIPYGKVPRRFEMSEPADGWTGTRNALDSGPGCIRLDLFSNSVKGIEDCLTLDIYTPLLPSTEGEIKPLPVMFWIHGGGFVDGNSGIYDGKYFMEQDVVLVAINYRLGPFGFLNAGVKSARGNQGMKDMVLALKWVQQNIDKFGGDPARVTIFGESAGGSAVSSLTLSPMTKDLFSGAIIQSGTAVCPYVENTNPGTKHAIKLAQAVDCPTSNTQYLVECLSRIQAEEFPKHTKFINEFGFNDQLIHFGPTIETYSDGESDEKNIFIKEDSFILAQRGEFHKVPMIIGMDSHEFILGLFGTLGNKELLTRLKTQFGRLLPGMMMYNEAAEDPALVTERIRDFFLEGKREFTSDDVWIWEAMLTDRHITQCSARMNEEYAKHTTVYAYNYTKREPSLSFVMSSEGGFKVNQNEENETNPRDRPAAHGDELKYLFELGPPFNALFKKVDQNHTRYEFSKALISLWSSFAIDGKPNKWGAADIEWTPLESGKPQQWLQIDDNPHMAPISEDFESRRKFWDSLPLKQYGKTWNDFHSNNSI